MRYYLFTRVITKREPINHFGKLGFTRHKEGVVIGADSMDGALKGLVPYNYKKHIRFYFEREVTKEDLSLYSIDEIVDLGIIR